MLSVAASHVTQESWGSVGATGPSGGLHGPASLPRPTEVAGGLGAAEDHRGPSVMVSPHSMTVCSQLDCFVQT